MNKNRVNALIEKIRDNDVDALLITKPENIFYLTSFFTDKAALVVSPEGVFIVVDFIYAEAASGGLSGVKIYVAKESFTGALAKAAREHKIKKLGFESLSLSHYRCETLKRGLKSADLAATTGLVELLREIKEDKEVLALKKALKITAETFKGLKKRLKPQATEREISNYIKEAFIKKGADGCSFEPIVATQPLSSRPHYVPGAKKLGRDKAIVVDMGARLKGYNSDLTRVCGLGKISTKFVSIYTILLEAQKRAIGRVKPGVKISDIDLAARQYINGKGLGKFFGHALGHGIGLEIHEKPAISHKNREPLKEGMVFSIEPGIYIPGVGGLRVEDMVCVTKSGCEILTDDIDKSI